jgi:multidrug efflux pump subunit AcrA (membrane-fusion protein)
VVLVGVGLLGISLLLGARLFGTGVTGSDPPKTANPTNGKNGSGPVVIGFVDSDPPKIEYGLPPHMQSGQIAKVSVHEGDHVKADDELFVFDTSMQQADLNRANAMLNKARAEENRATTLLKAHEQAVRTQILAVKAAKTKADSTAENYTNYDKFKREEYAKIQGWPAGRPLTPVEQRQVDDYMAADSRRAELKTTKEVAALEWETEQVRLDEVISAKVTKIDPAIAEAKAGVAQADAEVKRAETALNLCTVRAKTAGTIEQISISAGAVLNISTRTPALWLIPDGPRVVRAEVEAEFAHRVTPNMIGRQVTVYDHSDPSLTYKGTFKRISDAFLPKRSAGSNLLGNDTLVLEAVIEVTDAAPPGQPPLRVGQKVKVNFGQ